MVVQTSSAVNRYKTFVSYILDMVHRDIKLENILMSKNPEDCTDNLFIKVITNTKHIAKHILDEIRNTSHCICYCIFLAQLTDFGLSVVKGGVGHENMMMDFCGTPMYMGRWNQTSFG